MHFGSPKSTSIFSLIFSFQFHYKICFEWRERFTTSVTMKNQCQFSMHTFFIITITNKASFSTCQWLICLVRDSLMWSKTLDYTELNQRKPNIEIKQLLILFGSPNMQLYCVSLSDMFFYLFSVKGFNTRIYRDFFLVFRIMHHHWIWTMSRKRLKMCIIVFLFFF